MAQRAEHLRSLSLDHSEVRIWSRKWRTLKDSAIKVGRTCHLTFEQYTQLAVEAGLTKPQQIGTNPGNFQMGRNEDKGDYMMGNCRFIPKEQNLMERWMYKGKYANRSSTNSND